MAVINTIEYMDICSYCDIATESIQKSVEMGNYEGAHIQLSAYLIEIYSRYRNGEIDAKIWRETVSFYRRMTITVIDESNFQQQIESLQS